MLGNESVIVHDKNYKGNLPEAIQKFEQHFKVIGYYDKSELEKIVDAEKADIFYAIKAGRIDGVEVSNCKMCVHTVFKYFQPHGDVYAYVSEWLSKEMTKGIAPFVPHMIDVAHTDDDLRQELGIPKNAIVFGRHGGKDTFDVPFAKAAVQELSKKRKDIYFVFLGTKSFVFRSIFAKYRNVIFLPATTDEIYKAKFINTCDAYLHARKQGESFGIAIGEFSIRNKPVLTWADSEEKSHIDILGDKALIYKDKAELLNLLNDFKPDPTKDWDAYSEQYSAEVVMKKFKEVFID